MCPLLPALTTARHFRLEATHRAALLGRSQHPVQEMLLKLNLTSQGHAMGVCRVLGSSCPLGASFGATRRRTTSSSGHNVGQSHRVPPRCHRGCPTEPTTGSAEGAPWGRLWLQPEGIPLTRLCRLSSYGAGFPMGTQQGGMGQKQHWQRRDCEGECAELLSPKSGAARSTRPAQQLWGWGLWDPWGPTHVHLIHVHDGGGRPEGAQAVAHPVLQRHAPKLAIVGCSPPAQSTEWCWRIHKAQRGEAPLPRSIP